MKTTRLITVLAAALAVALGSVAPTPAFADRGHGGRPGYGYVKPGYYPAHYRGYGGYYRPYWGPRYSVGVYLGPGFWSGYYPYYGYGGYGPYYYPPYPYYPPAVATVPAQPQTYIERGAPADAPGPASYWYYCREANAYYPYVKQCPGGWEQVNPTPPPR
ncbi:MAG TPA: hypothetical protein VFP70_10690 [Burkholderiales bacterium]|nr:hypothetical protein [Burkholderiales bacterium]